MALYLTNQIVVKKNLITQVYYCQNLGPFGPLGPLGLKGPKRPQGSESVAGRESALLRPDIRAAGRGGATSYLAALALRIGLCWM